MSNLLCIINYIMFYYIICTILFGIFDDFYFVYYSILFTFLFILLFHILIPTANQQVLVKHACHSKRIWLNKNIFGVCLFCQWWFTICCWYVKYTRQHINCWCCRLSIIELNATVSINIGSFYSIDAEAVQKCLAPMFSC